MEKRAALAALILSLCSLFACKHGTKSVVVLDDQWAVKQAQLDCQSRQQEGLAPCADDPVVMIRDLEAKTVQAFRMSKECRGITFVTLNTSDHPSELSSIHTWWLFLELMRSNVVGELRYTVARSHDPHTHGSATGQGVPDSIVNELCSFVQQGGTVE
jgi:hypothetical protein